MANWNKETEGGIDMNDIEKNNQNIEVKAEQLAKRIEALVVEARKKIASTVNVAMVYTYFEVGRYIIEDEQGGKTRAEYGKKVLKRVSERLTSSLGKGWSVDTLEKTRRFFQAFSKSATPQRILAEGENSATVQRKFVLSWNHYQILSHVDNSEARNFYEIEAFEQQWSIRYLQRQIGSGLYERLALSRDKDEVMRLATEGLVVEKPSDIIKDPLVLEFCGLKPDASYSETDLERAIISRLQDFLLEMGKGFLFEARQKRFTFEERHFYVDLVLYNRLLQCYVLVDLKMDDLTHQDLGQMQMYVNYYDRFVKEDFEKPTIGILLCERKNDTLVELTLPEDANIYAQQYALCLPDKALLQQKLREWIEEFKQKEDEG